MHFSEALRGIGGGILPVVEDDLLIGLRIGDVFVLLTTSLGSSGFDEFGDCLLVSGAPCWFIFSLLPTVSPL